MTRLTEFAPAKINLSLHVGPLKPNKRHDLVSMVTFADIETADILSAVPASQFSLAVDGPFGRDSGPAKHNLVLKAARALNDALDGDVPKLAFRLQKKLPCAAGIGGGSADAGAALRLMVKAHGGESAATMAEAVAPILGGDVLACYKSYSGFMSGEGEAYEPAMSLPPMPCVLVNPRIDCPTGPVFEAYDRASPARVLQHPPLPDNRTALPSFMLWLSANTQNSLQEPALKMHPEIASCLNELRSCSDVQLVRMSGSGATCFGIFDSMETAEKAASGLRVQNPAWWVQSTLLGGAL